MVEVTTSVIVRFRDGSRSAFGHVARYCIDRAAACTRRCGGHRVSDRDDLVQESLVELWVRRTQLAPRLTNRASLMYILGMLVRQKASRSVRDGTRRRRDDSTTIRDGDRPADAPAALAGLTDEAPDPFRHACARETLAAFMSCLTPVQRQVVELTMDGHTRPEVSRRLGWSLRTIERHLESAQTLALEWLRRAGPD